MTQARRTFVRTSKNALMLLLGTVLRMVATFAFVLYCADQMGVEGFGKYSLVIHYFELFLSLTATAAGILLTRDVARWKRQTAQLFTSALQLVIVLCVLAPIPLLGCSFVFGYSADTINAILLASIALFPASICVLFEALFVAKERAEFVTLATAIESLARVALGLFVLWMGYGLYELILILLLVRSAMLIIYVRLWNIKKQPLISFHPRRAIRMIARWRVFAAENWMATIYTSLDVVVLSWISGEVATGLYSAAWKIVRLGSAVAKSYTTAIYPVMSRIYSQSKIAFAQLYQQTIRVMCALSLPAIAVITVIPDRVVELLYNDEYVAAAPILRILIWVLFIDFLNPFLSHALFAKGKQHRSMHVAGISLAVNAIATYLLVSGWGAIGAAMGTLIGGVVAMCCYLAFTMSRSEIVEVVQTATRIAAAATGVALSTYFLRDYSWVSIFCVSVSVYLPLLFLVGAFSSRDLDLIRNSVRLKGATS